jgi:hypothetical protein
MTDAAAILEVRHVRLAEQATLRPASLGTASPEPETVGEEGVFVALDDPPPVRTVLAVVEGDRRRALEVVWVVEVAERDEIRGFYGRWVADEALSRAVKVGTEHLEDGTPVVQPVVYDHSSMIEVSDAPVMAMPAPVMIVDDDTGGGDDDEREDADEPQAYTSDAGRYGAYEAEAGEQAGEHGSPASNVQARLHGYTEPSDQAGQYGAAASGEPGGRYGAAETNDAANQYGAAETSDAAGQYDASEANDQDAADADDGGAESSAQDEAADTSTDSGEAPTEAADGDAGDSRSKGRKKRSRKRR